MLSGIGTGTDWVKLAGSDLRDTIAFFLYVKQSLTTGNSASTTIFYNRSAFDK